MILLIYNSQIYILSKWTNIFVMIIVICMVNSKPAYGYHVISGNVLSNSVKQKNPAKVTQHYTVTKKQTGSKKILAVPNYPKELQTAQLKSPQLLKYKVQSGDTLYRIAKQFQVSEDAIQNENRIRNANLLQVGQELTIPTVNPIISAAVETTSSQQTITRVLTAKLTAYTAGYESTGKRASDPAYGITSSGTKVKEGRTIAVDPTIIPIGSTVFIEGIGYRKAEDTGSAIKGSRIDVYIKDLDEAVDFGVKKGVKVYVISNKQANI